MKLNSSRGFWGGNAPTQISEMLKALWLLAGGTVEGKYAVLAKADRIACLDVIHGCSDEYEAARRVISEVMANGSAPTSVVAYVFGHSKTCAGCGGAPMLHWIVPTVEKLR